MLFETPCIFLGGKISCYSRNTLDQVRMAQKIAFCCGLVHVTVLALDLPCLVPESITIAHWHKCFCSEYCVRFLGWVYGWHKCYCCWEDMG